ncbi:MAG: tetratricopeptide repeat protein [Chloroflexota bacterium]
MEHTAEYYYEQSEEKWKKHDAVGSFAALGEAIRLDPTNTYYLWERGLRHSFREERELSEKDFTRIIELSSDLDEIAKARWHRAVCYELLAWPDDLFRDLTWIIENDKGDEDTYIWRGNCHLRAKRYGEAIADFSTALELSPQAGMALWRRAQINFHLGGYEEALQDLTRLVAIADKDNPLDSNTIYTTRSVCFYRLNRYVDALDDFNRVREIVGEPTISDLSSEKAFFEGYYFNFQQMRGP